MNIVSIQISEMNNEYLTGYSVVKALESILLVCRGVLQIEFKYTALIRLLP